jgi:hypothetical protein
VEKQEDANRGARFAQKSPEERVFEVEVSGISENCFVVEVSRVVEWSVFARMGEKLILVRLIEEA